MVVKDLLKDKSRTVHTISADRKVEDAIAAMSSSETAALIVMDAGQPVGIFAERDVLKCHLENRGRRFVDVDVREAMTRTLIVAEPQEDIRAALATMIKAGIRHLPVVDGGEIVGMLTINDLVEHQVDTLTAELHYLQDYINDLQDADRD